MTKEIPKLLKITAGYREGNGETHITKPGHVRCKLPKSKTPTKEIERQIGLTRALTRHPFCEKPKPFDQLSYFTETFA